MRWSQCLLHSKTPDVKQFNICVQFVYATNDSCVSEWHDHRIGLFSLTPTEKEQSDEVLRGEIIKVSKHQ